MNKKVMIVLICGIIPRSAVATVLPDTGSVSGQLLQNNPMLNSTPPPRGEDSVTLPAPEPAEKENKKDGPQLYVSRIKINDLPLSAAPDVNLLLAHYRHQNMTLNQLRNIAIDITALIQAKGERLSYAYVPDQKITHGVVTINVMQGFIEAIRIHRNRSLVSDATVNRYVEEMIAFKNKIQAVDSALLKISDLPGVGNISSFLRPGKQPGSSALWLDLTPSRRVTGALVFDNMGSLSSGRDRIGAQINLNSPFGIGDRFQALVYAAPDFLQTTHDSDKGNTLIGRLAYDAALGGRGQRLGLAASRVSYKLGGPALRGLGDGYASIFSLYGSYPLVRSAMRNLTVGFNLDFKRLQDNFWGMKNARRAELLALEFSADRQGRVWEKPTFFQYQIAPAVGRLENSDDWNGGDTKGRYFKLNETAHYLLGLSPGITLSMNFSGQQASRNLDGAEKLSLGGPYAVRAYSNSAASVDSGWIASPSLRLSVPEMENTTVELFYDYARGKLQKYAPVSQEVTLKGYGVGLNYNVATWGFIHGSYGWRQGRDKLVTPQNKATAWLTMGVFF